jgi:hypothetical protein
MSSTSYEARVTLALKAIQINKNLSLRAAAKIYNVDHTTLSRRRAGRPTRHDIPANSRKLTDLEEETIVQYILELGARSFPPRLCSVEDMANQLLRARDASSVGQR